MDKKMRSIVTMFLLIPFLGYSQTQVGEEILTNNATLHPYSGNSGSNYQTVWSQQVSHVDVSKLNSGIYFLRVLSAENAEVSVRKLIIQK